MARAVSEFQSLLSGLAAELEGRIARAVPSLAQLDRRELLAFVTDAFPDWVTPYLAAAADLTTVWYDDQLSDSDFRAVPAELAPADQLAISGRWAMLQPDPAMALGGAGTRALFQASRDTVVDNTVREGIRWARHASANACGFCRMLATLEDHYSSEASALGLQHLDEQGHNHCHCIAVPVRSGEYVAPAYVEQWKRDYKQARADGAKTPGEIANAMDYLPGGRRYKGDEGGEKPKLRAKPVDLDAPRENHAPAPEPRETDAEVAARLLPGLEKSLATTWRKSPSTAAESPRLRNRPP